MSGYCPDCGNTHCLCTEIAVDESLVTLEELKRTVEHAISIMDIQCLIPMSSHEIYDYKRRFGDFDFIIGDFGVKRIHGGKAKLR